MRSFFVAIILIIIAGTVHAQAPAQESLDKHGLIKPTSKGSSGTPDTSIEQGTGDEGGVSAINGGIMPDTGSTGTDSQAVPNPYPNATSGTGTINGGSVTGTGALNSAHPGH